MNFLANGHANRRASTMPSSSTLQPTRWSKAALRLVLKIRHHRAGDEPTPLVAGRPADQVHPRTMSSTCAPTGRLHRAFWLCARQPVCGQRARRVPPSQIRNSGRLVAALQVSRCRRAKESISGRAEIFRQRSAERIELCNILRARHHFAVSDGGDITCRGPLFQIAIPSRVSPWRVHTDSMGWLINAS